MYLVKDRAGFNVSTNTIQVIQKTVLQIKRRPNQQHQSIEGKQLASHHKRIQSDKALSTILQVNLEKRKTLSQWVEPSETKPHTAGRPVQVLYRTIDYLSDRTCHTVPSLHQAKKQQEAQLLLGDRATRKHAKDS